MNVRVLGSSEAAALVEWRDEEGLHRSLVPAGLVTAGKCETPELGVPYGVPWADVVPLQVTPQQLEQVLYSRGLWTAQDVLAATPVTLLGLLQQLYGLDVATLIQAAQAILRQGVHPNGR